MVEVLLSFEKRKRSELQFICDGTVTGEEYLPMLEQRLSQL